jgi:hypothetical protein
MQLWHPLLVVCPASLRLLWAEELEKWLPCVRPCDVHIIQHCHEWRPDAFCNLGCAPMGCDVRHAHRRADNDSAHPCSVPTGVDSHTNTLTSAAEAMSASKGKDECSEVACAASCTTGSGSAPGTTRTGGDDETTKPSSVPLDRSSPRGVPACSSSVAETGKTQPPQVVVISYTLLPLLCCKECCRKARHGQSSKVEPRAECPAFPHCVAAAAFDFVIVDESHRLQTHNNQDPIQTTVTRQIVRQARKAVLLSGTPSMSRPFDMCGQLHALQPQRLGLDFNRFKTAFGFRCAPRLHVSQSHPCSLWFYSTVCWGYEPTNGTLVP